MPSKVEDLEDEIEIPTNINPYKVLGIEKSATENEIKSAYRKLALKQHPDKVPEDEKEEAKEQFQKLSFAYGILSDPRRRSRYDTTGRTSESANLDDDDDINWSDFFRAQFADVVSADAIEKFKAEYQGSEEEKLDVISSYMNHEGDMDALFEEIMLSNVLDDEERFKQIIDEEIREKRVEAFDAYVKDSKAKRTKRVKEAKKEAKEAEAEAKKLGLKKDGGMDSLTALIQQRQKDRAGTFFDDLEAKYAPKKGGKKNKRGAGVEPPEEAFQRNKKKAKRTSDAGAGGDEEAEVERPRAKRARRV